MTVPWVRAESARPQMKQASASSSFSALQDGQIMAVVPDCVPEWPHPASPRPRHELAAGSCFVNAFVKSDPRLPLGGIRESGYGRELAAYGIRGFVNVKTVYVA